MTSTQIPCRTYYDNLFKNIKDKYYIRDTILDINDPEWDTYLSMFATCDYKNIQFEKNNLHNKFTF